MDYEYAKLTKLEISENGLNVYGNELPLPNDSSLIGYVTYPWFKGYATVTLKDGTTITAYEKMYKVSPKKELYINLSFDNTIDPDSINQIEYSDQIIYTAE